MVGYKRRRPRGPTAILGSGVEVSTELLAGGGRNGVGAGIPTTPRFNPEETAVPIAGRARGFDFSSEPPSKWGEMALKRAFFASKWLKMPLNPPGLPPKRHPNGPKVP